MELSTESADCQHGVEFRCWGGPPAKLALSQVGDLLGRVVVVVVEEVEFKGMSVLFIFFCILEA